MNHSRHSACESLGKSVDTMSSDLTLNLLHSYAYNAALFGDGIVVEIGAYRGGSTVALAKGVQKAGRGLITSIDPHIPATGIYGGIFSSEDHERYLENLERFGVIPWVRHICTDAKTAACEWSSSIDLLWIDGDHRYEGVSSDISLWVPFVKDQGIVIFDDVVPGSEVEAAIRDHLPFSRFRLVEQLNNVLVFQKQSKPRTLYLCGGMQSGGSTLVSWCFLQRHDLDGVLDMENSLIYQDFSRVKSADVWLKMTIGSFRLAELVSLYEAQGWRVKPLLVHRELSATYRSLRGKSYGFDGATADEPPIFIRIQRYLADLDTAQTKDWPVLKYEELVNDAEATLRITCKLLDLAWDEAMVSWPKADGSIAYPENGNSSFLNTKHGSPNLQSALDKYRQQDKLCDVTNKPSFIEVIVKATDPPLPPAIAVAQSPLLPPVRFWGTQRQILYRELCELRDMEFDYSRIKQHNIIGPLLKFWKRFINNSIPPQN